MSVGAIVIGRNEGARLIACLDALTDVTPVIYVDSGSTDGSIAAAQARGAQVVPLDMAQPFTAARARNAGLEALPEDVDLVQFLDGDCIVRGGWIAQAQAFLEATPDVAVVCGRRREMYPQASIYNALIDAEWDTPVGEALACGGDALMRVGALRAVGGYNALLIAGEEPDLCLRLRAEGWRIWRLDVEMTAHDAQIMRFDQWWQRTKRAGHAFAEGAALHGSSPERHWVAETRRALMWGMAVPLLIALLTVLIGPYGLLAALVYPVQVMRLARRGGWAWAVFSVLGKLAEAQGAIGYYWRRLSGGQRSLIEYK
ncbi:glycosyltransferase family 2 protein [Sulfitobacter guttiformis]|uniref:GT2 family glycosyltransferase n=1 Tax=Sulfitobacter guttiformis TaxID=74349 RepID=A0A420DNY2_9RHOB|nr:glycosyltransferase [Sulfitobacter guttiformis]KIN73206.1 Glycosyl transferase, family 2 [Sulfitobacter guttiformis KCTC 32187]RKE95883.1 GT2 family glycosyltransferase [Sulfitobacter guttiformis]